MQNLTGTIRFNSDGICYIRIKGISAHSSEPQNGVNAGVRLASFLRQYAFQPKGELLLRWLTDHLGDPFGEGLRLDPIQDASGRLTVCPGKIYFDTDKSKISINIRTPVTILPVQIAKKICKLATEDGWEISDLRISPPHYVRPDHPVVRTLMNVFRERTGLEPAAIYSSGNTLANMMKFGVAFGPIFPGERNSSHEANESIAVSSLVQCVSIYAQALYELTGIDGEV